MQVPDPTEIIVTGAPFGFDRIRGWSANRTAAALNDHTQVLNVAAGAHKVEIHVGDTVVYREDT